MRAAFESADAAVQDEGIPADEAERLVSLHRLGLLDTQPSAAFDGVTRLAAAALRVPLLLVALVDQNRVWYKSRVGLTLRESPRMGSFCAQAILQREPLSVRDASTDRNRTGECTGSFHLQRAGAQFDQTGRTGDFAGARHAGIVGYSEAIIARIKRHDTRRERTAQVHRGRHAHRIVKQDLIAGVEHNLLAIVNFDPVG